MNDPQASARELERALTELQLPGAMLFSNVNGAMLSEEQFWPIYEVANEHGAMLHIHPTNPANVDADEGLLADAAGRFPVRYDAGGREPGVQPAVAERFPRIKWVLATSAARFRTSPSGSTAATTPSVSAAQNIDRRRASI